MSFDRSISTGTGVADGARSALAGRLDDVRAETERLASGLTGEDQAIQSMPDASPTKWHLAHTSWFFETFILARLDPGYRVFDAAFGYLFNSYYEAVGPRHPRPARGLLSRPSVAEIGAYRRYVTAAMARFARHAGEDAWREAAPLIELGIHHEQQHQELILMDIKHVFSMNPLLPAYHAAERPGSVPASPPGWVEHGAGLAEIGHPGPGFAFDNETPRHKVWLEPFRLATRPVSCGDWREFIAEGGYRRPEFWLSDGWACAREQNWQAPLYWHEEGAGWSLFTLAGRRELDEGEPVCHVSFYEADAFAKWAGKRLPSEAEWEVAAEGVMVEGMAPGGNLADRLLYHPAASPPAAGAPALAQMFGDVWEWTASPYTPYPRFRAAPGAVGEYNGKFMCNQIVLRGGSAVTPSGHVRASYRNFFPPSARWVFAGLRLAEDGE
jgi:ergothioneine biosynthesis protein EgtB